MKLLGGIIPILKFKNYQLTNEGLPILKREDGRSSGYNSDTLIFEWLENVYILFTTEVKEDKING